MKHTLLFSFILSVATFSSFAYSTTDCNNANTLASKGIVSYNASCDGYSLDRTVLRQEVAAITYKVAQSCNVLAQSTFYTCQNMFADVRANVPNTWACTPIEILAGVDIVSLSKTDSSGYPVFRPEREITQAEMLAMLLKAGGFGTNDVYTFGSAFAPGTVAWQQPIIKKASDLGVIGATSNFYPNQRALRRDIFSIANAVVAQCSGTTTNNNTLNCFQIPANSTRISSQSCAWRCNTGYVQVDQLCVYDDRDFSYSSGDIELEFDTSVDVDEDDDEVEIEFCLEERADGDVEIEYQTLNGTARSGNDYIAQNRTLTIDEWDRCETIEITIYDDNTREGDEYFVVEIEDVDNDGSDRIWFREDRIRIDIDDDDRSGSSGDIELEANNETVDEDDDEVEIEFCLDDEADGDVEIEYRTVSGTARSGVDYEFVNDSVFIDEWDLCETIEIEIIDDNLDENTEYFTVEIEDVTNDGDDDIEVVDETIRVNIRDDETNSSSGDDIEIEIDDETIDEDDDEVELEICLSETTDEDVEVEWSTESKTARSLSDFTNTSGITTIEAGDRCETIEIDIRDDNVDEDTEYFLVILEDFEYDGDDDVEIRDDEARVTIRDDDGGSNSNSGDIDLEADDETVDEDDDEVRIEFCLDDEADGDVEIEYRTRDGSARSGSDYEYTSDTVTIDEWDRCETIEIEIEDDSRSESTEYFWVEIEDVDNDGDDDIYIVDEQIRVTIRDDDRSGSGSYGDIELEVRDETVDEDDDEVEIKFCLDDEVDGDVEIEYRTLSATARSGSDYYAKSGTVRIDEWDRCESIEIDIIDDSAREDSEYFIIQIEDVDNDGSDDIDVIDSVARITIRDDDSRYYNYPTYYPPTYYTPPYTNYPTSYPSTCSNNAINPPFCDLCGHGTRYDGFRCR